MTLKVSSRMPLFPAYPSLLKYWSKHAQDHYRPVIRCRARVLYAGDYHHDEAGNMLEKQNKRCLIIAHRGASAYEPENTLRAFRRAIELKADMCELDVHLSQDDKLVVIHDSRVEKTTDGKGAVRGLSLADLKLLDAGKGERIPTFQEAIDTTRGKCGLYIELKAENTPLPVVNTLRINKLTDPSQVIVGSFKSNLIKDIKSHAPEIATSILVGEVLAAEELIALARCTRADYVHLCWEKRTPQPHKLLTPPLLKSLRDAGLGIILWHEERPEELDALCTLNVDGICSNNPDFLASRLK
jgi:glycerophosphoryl diester phosphodiesterase